MLCEETTTLVAGFRDAFMVCLRNIDNIFEYAPLTNHRLRR